MIPGRELHGDLDELGGDGPAAIFRQDGHEEEAEDPVDGWIIFEVLERSKGRTF